MAMFRVVALGSAVLALCPIGFGACNSGGMVGSVGRPGTWAVVSVPTTEGLTIVRGSGSTEERHSHYANLTFGVGQLVWRSLGSRRFGHSASFHAMNFTPLQSVGTL